MNPISSSSSGMDEVILNEQFATNAKLNEMMSLMQEVAIKQHTVIAPSLQEHEENVYHILSALKPSAVDSTTNGNATTSTNSTTISGEKHKVSRDVFNDCTKVYCLERDINSERSQNMLRTLLSYDCHDCVLRSTPHDNTTRSFLNAAKRCHNDIVVAFLDNGMNINCVDGTTGNSALITCCMERNTLPMVQLLLERNADVNIRSTFHNTALIWACKNGLEEIVRLLLNHGADIKHKNKEGLDAMSAATKQENIKQLIQQQQQQQQQR